MQSLDVWCVSLCGTKGQYQGGLHAHSRTCHPKVVDKPNQPSMAVETVRATLETIVHVLIMVKATRHKILTIQHLMNRRINYVIYSMMMRCRAYRFIYFVCV